MSDILNSAKNIISIIFAIIVLPFTMLAPAEKYEAKKPDEVLTSFSILSDCHIEGNNYETFEVYRDILKGVKSAEKKDALVFLGDNTMNGQEIENLFFFSGLKLANPAKNLIVAAGNHDFGNGEGDFNEMYNRYLKYNNMYLGAKIEKPYFYKVINGCYFIVLSTEEHTVNFMSISEEQLTWLKSLLDEASEKNSPIFVFNHYPINYIAGESPEALNNLLAGYKNLLYFCGHTHLPLNQSSIYKVNGVNCVNIPKSTEHAYGQDAYNCGIGAVVEVYEDEILLRIRDFYDNEWVEGYEFSYPIVK